MKPVNLNELGKYVDAVNDIQSKWMLVTSEKDGKVNTLTASWGALGSLWRKKVAMIFIRPSRYTNEFLEANNHFTLTFFNGHMDEMGYLGKTSGREVPDKIEKAGLTSIKVDGQPTFKEGRLMLSCRTIYVDPIEREKFLEKEIDDELNPDGNRSIMYVAEIEAAYDLTPETKVILHTNMGDITILMHDDMPITTGNFVKLAKKGFYDGTIFHRVINNFMIQGGDPEGTGRGGPGYTIEDEFGHGHSNQPGFVSMANTGRPHSGGSQFFINTNDNGYLDKENPTTPYAHPVFGQVIEGMDVVEKIQKVKTGRDDKPVEDVVILKAEVIE